MGLYNKYIKGKDLGRVLILALIVFILPFVIVLRVEEISGDLYYVWNGESTICDFFSYHKMAIFCILTYLNVIIFFFTFYKHKDRYVLIKNKINVLIFIFALFVILSSIFSSYKGIAFYGYVKRYEGMFVLLFYMITLFITMNIVINEHQFKFILGALTVSALIIGIIGLLQAFEIDILNMEFYKKIQYIFHRDSAGAFKLGFDNKILSSVFQHYNYTGSYMAMIFPFTLCLTLLIKNKKLKGFMLFMTAFMFFNLIGCTSRAGLVGAILAVCFLIVILRKEIMYQWKLSLSLSLILILVFVGVNIMNEGYTKKRLTSLHNDVVSIKGDSKKKGNDSEINQLEELEVTKDTIRMKSVGNTMIIKLKDNVLTINLPNKEVEQYDIIKNVWKGKYTEDKFNGFKLRLVKCNDERTLLIHKKNVGLRFAITLEGLKNMNYAGKNLEPKPIENWGFEGKEKMGSARGYIWSRSIPLIKNTLLWGYGPDTFAAYFPQEDYAGKYKAYGTTEMVVDKAHNMYLATAINTGVISLIAMLGIFGVYIISSFKLFMKNDFKDFYSKVGIAIFLAIVGYLGAAFFNDSVVSIAPIFWILLGLGIRANYNLNFKIKLQLIVG